jgi:hypothetical protein
MDHLLINMRGAVGHLVWYVGYQIGAVGPRDLRSAG